MRSIALAIAALLLLASCSDDPEPIEPTASPPRTTRRAAYPSRPLHGTTRRLEPRTFVKHWIEVSNYAAHDRRHRRAERTIRRRLHRLRQHTSNYTNRSTPAAATSRAHRRKIGEVNLEIAAGEVVVSGEVRAEEGRYKDSKNGQEHVSKANVTASNSRWRSTGDGESSRSAFLNRCEARSSLQ